MWLAPAYCLVGCLAALSTDVYMYIFLRCLIAAIGISLYIAGFVLGKEAGHVALALGAMGGRIVFF